MITIGTQGKNTIALSEPSVRGEAVIKTAGMLPGQLVSFVKENGLSGTPVEKLTAHATQYGATPVRVLLEDSIQGKTVDQAYAANDYAPFGVFDAGARVLVRIAASSTVAYGTRLQSNGDGNFCAAGATVTDHTILLEAREAVTTTATTALIIAEVL